MPKPNQNRQKAHRHGHRAEWFAAAALMLKGYRIVHMRYKTKIGEIDIIARKRDLIAVVEVKARKTLDDAVNAVTENSKRRINNAIDLWLAKQSDAAELSIRFDIVAVTPRRWPIHLENAF